MEKKASPWVSKAMVPSVTIGASSSTSVICTYTELPAVAEPPRQVTQGRLLEAQALRRQRHGESSKRALRRAVPCRRRSPASSCGSVSSKSAPRRASPCRRRSCMSSSGGGSSKSALGRAPPRKRCCRGSVRAGQLEEGIRRRLRRFFNEAPDLALKLQKDGILAQALLVQRVTHTTFVGNCWRDPCGEWRNIGLFSLGDQSAPIPAMRRMMTISNRSENTSGRLLPLRQQGLHIIAQLAAEICQLLG
mmetsp:Transcript_38110/g.98791  ORF Transcript_38110/g.98791 Transcript_38110/m.98791 type:complete len:248 (+) Transcript_38110:2-745(+)